MEQTPIKSLTKSMISVDPHREIQCKPAQAFLPDCMPFGNTERLTAVRAGLRCEGRWLGEVIGEVMRETA